MSLNIVLAIRDFPEKKFGGLPEKTANEILKAITDTLTEKSIKLCSSEIFYGYVPKEHLESLSAQGVHTLLIPIGIFDSDPINPSVYDRLTGIDKAPPAEAVTWIYKDVPPVLNRNIAEEVCKDSHWTIRPLYAASSTVDHLHTAYKLPLNQGEGKIALLQFDIRKTALSASHTNLLAKNIGELAARSAARHLCG